MDANVRMWMDANVSMWMDPCVMVVMYVPSAAQSICAQFCDVCAKCGTMYVCEMWHMR
jgi:hypothetical protein